MKTHHKSLRLSDKALKKAERIAKKQNRSFSNLLETLILKEKE